MKSIISIFLMAVSAITFAFILLLNPLSLHTGIAADKTATVTPTPTQRVRKVKLYPGYYAGPIHAEGKREILNQQDPNNWMYLIEKWNLDGMVYITVPEAGTAKARLVFTQIEGFGINDHQIYTPDTGFVCHATVMAQGNIVTISQSVTFNPEDGTFSIPINIFNVNAYGVLDQEEGPSCTHMGTGQEVQGLVDSTLMLDRIDFTVDTVEPTSSTAANAKNCSLGALAEAAKASAVHSETCHWQVHKLTKKPSGWKK